jgi:hypothetical protein
LPERLDPVAPDRAKATSATVIKSWVAPHVTVAAPPLAPGHG